ncbi:MAG TPA: PQQ-binding-like beta-propeller repeat protein, partial [Acidimicrobiales bacterium]
LTQYFAPASWASDNRDDLDFSTGPALLSDGQVLIAGKSQIVYLLNGSTLGGIAGEETMLPHACNDVIDGGMAVVGTTVYLPCESGVVALSTTASPASLRVLWSSSLGGGPPIVAAGLVWSITQGGELYGLNPDTGKYVTQATVGQEANHFPTPSVGAGLLLVPTATHVVAFATNEFSPAPTATTSTTRAPARASSPTHHRPASKGGLSGGVVTAIAVAVVAFGALAALWWRRRRRRR